MRFSSPLAAATAAGLLCTARGYMIDTASCTGDTLTLVTDMVEQAINMANLALVAVDETPISASTNRLLQSLFGAAPDSEGNNAAGKAIIENTFMATSPNNKGGAFGILSFKTPVTDTTQLGPNDVKIYCDQSRYKRMAKDPLHIYDTDANYVVSKIVTDCATGFAWTSAQPNHWDVIQLCPWFLQYAFAKKYHTKKGITSVRAWLAVVGADKWMTKKLYTPIDLESLWDKVMLHEFTHTKAGRLKRDVNGVKGYGWKNCVALAASNTRNAANNADSYALFGSASYFIAAGNPIDDNGNFIQATGAKLRRLVHSIGGLKNRPWLAAISLPSP